MMTGARGTSPGRPFGNCRLQLSKRVTGKAVAAPQNLAPHAVQRKRGVALGVAAGIGRALALLGDGEHLHHDDDAQHADRHADQDLDEAEAGLAGRLIANCRFHIDFLYLIWAMAT